MGHGALRLRRGVDHHTQSLLVEYIDQAQDLLLADRISDVYLLQITVICSSILWPTSRDVALFLQVIAVVPSVLNNHY